MSSGVSLTSWGEGASLVLVGYPSSVGVTIVTYWINVLLHQPAPHPSFPIGLVKVESDFIVRSVETGSTETELGSSDQVAFLSAGKITG